MAERPLRERETARVNAGSRQSVLTLRQVHRGVSLWLDLKQSDCDTIKCKTIYARQTHSANKAQTAKESNAYR